MVVAVYPIRCSNDVKFAEVVAVLKGIELANDTGLSPVTIESDALNIFKLVKGIITTKSEMG